MARSSRMRTLLMIAAVSVLNGCGTMANLGGLNPEHYMEVYGGVRNDLQHCGQSLKEASESSEGNTRASVLLAGALITADLPLSAIADTLTLPFTIEATLNGEAFFGLAKPSGRTPLSAARTQGGTALPDREQAAGPTP